MTKRAALYGRVSTDEQRDNYSIPSQMAACLEYATKQGYTIVGDQFVNSETGRDTDSRRDGSIQAYVDDYTSRELSRPALDAALLYLGSVGFDVLIVHAIDRLARDPYVRRTLEIEFEQRGAKVEYVLGGYDDTPEGEVKKDLDATFAKWENAKRVERSNRGKKRKAEGGLFVGGIAPYGYVIDKTAFGGLAVVDEQATIVRHVFHLYVEEGLSIRGIARALTQDGIRPALRAKGWCMTSVGKMLKNQIYVGRGFYNKRKRNGDRLERNGRDEWIEFKTTPIVDRRLFDEAQRLLEENAKIRRRQPSRFYLLSGMVFCSLCERPYFAQTAKANKHGRINDSQFYRHRSAHGHCCNHQITARVLEPLVWEGITKTLLDPERLKEGYLGSIDQQEKTAARRRTHLETLRRRVGSLEQMRRNLIDAYTDPEIRLTRSEYLEHRDRVDGELLEVRTDIEQTEKELTSIPTPADLKTLETFAATVREVMTDSECMTPQEKRKVLKMLQVRVMISRQSEEIRLEGWFGPQIEGFSKITSSCGLRCFIFG